MGKNFKLALIGLLGFSAACSTVRKTDVGGNAERADRADKTDRLDRTDRTADEPAAVEQPAEMYPSIRVMYGVRPPASNSMTVPAPPEEAEGETSAAKDEKSE